jgi:hypothetical protein
MNLTKFGSLHLNTPNSRYEFLKFAFKSVKTNKEKHSKTRNPLHAPHSDWRLGPAVNRPHLPVKPKQRLALTGENSLTMRSLAVRSPPLDSTRPPASTGTLGWLRDSLELAQQQPWRTAALHGGDIAITGNGELTWAWLRLQDVLPEI